MKALEQFILHDPMRLLSPLLVLAATLAIGRLVKGLVFRGLRGWIKRTQSHAATTVTQSLDGPFMIWVLILGLHLASRSSELPERWTGYITQALLALWILSAAIMGSKLVGNLFRFYGSSIPGALPVTTLTRNLAQLAIMLVAAMILLKLILGISIAPLLTALGVGGLAVALALQDTLSNLFAGFYVAVARQVRLGDYIKLNTGEEGYVTDITWRSTVVRTLGSNMIIVPNSKLAQAIVTNYYLPEKRLSMQVQVGVSYSSDADQVERVLLEETIFATGAVPGLLAAPAPNVTFDPGFGNSALGFTLTCHVAEFADQFQVRNELRKRILKRFRQEGIEMPYPTRTVFLSRNETSTSSPPQSKSPDAASGASSGGVTTKT